MRVVLLASVVSVLLAGCQSAQESMYNAEVSCRQQGLKIGTQAYQKCVDAGYDNSRRQSDQATNTAVIAGAAGAAGGVLVGNAMAPAPRYYACDPWGCW